MYLPRAIAFNGFQELVLWVSIAVAMANVSDEDDSYPKIIYQERIEPSLFVRDPNRLNNVTSISISRVRPSARRNEEIHIEYGKEIDKKLRCRKANFQGGKWLTWKMNLPGTFKCGEKNFPLMAYVIPTIVVEEGRFFNVSLDFLKLETTSEFNSSRLISHDLPVQLQLSSSGIMFLSGLFVNLNGPVTIATDISSVYDDYRTKIRLQVTQAQISQADQRVDIELNHHTLTLNSHALLFRYRLNSIMCISEVLALPATALRQINFDETTDRQKLIVSGTLRPTRADGGELHLCRHLNSINHHTIDGIVENSTSEACAGFIIRNVRLNNRECGRDNFEEQMPTTLEYDEDQDTENPLLRISQADDLTEQGFDNFRETTTVTSTTIEEPHFAEIPESVAADEKSKYNKPIIDRTIPKLISSMTTTTQWSNQFMEPTTAAPITKMNMSTITTHRSTKKPVSTNKPTTTTITTTAVSVPSQTTVSSYLNNIIDISKNENKISAFASEKQSAEDSQITKSPRTNSLRVGVTNRERGSNKQLQVLKFNQPVANAGDPVGEYRLDGASNSTHPFLQSTEVYGITALASVPLIVVFVVLFYKMAQCKSKGGYDPVQTNLNGLSGEPIFIDRADSPIPRRDSRC
ncbi:uncharacterized protein LOC111247447 [Varroa destructor]|uniref:Uncharacterized protein n=1 Tax=Varroa destructor TaxID=109461 RepID=A0A7M7JLU2_VARDE|nr:uncharacterized protein LOC111247447 [Varroa destructor]XP_022654092.1 uncharacterized protein LOC111247447 [Varroa destructor]